MCFVSPACLASLAVATGPAFSQTATPQAKNGGYSIFAGITDAIRAQMARGK